MFTLSVVFYLNIAGYNQFSLVRQLQGFIYLWYISRVLKHHHDQMKLGGYKRTCAVGLAKPRGLQAAAES